MGALAILELRAYGENEYKTNDAAVFGIGGGIDYTASKAFTVNGGIKVLFGRLGGGNKAKGLTGYEIWISSIYNF